MSTPTKAIELSRIYVHGDRQDELPTLADQFELWIDKLAQAGYKLQSWKLSRLILNNNNINEKIIAIFTHTNHS